MKRAAAVFFGTMGCTTAAFHPALAQTPWFWLLLLLPHLVLGGYYVYRCWDEGSLLERLQPRWGDLSLAALMAMALLFGSIAVQAKLTPPGSAEQAWLLRIFSQLGSGLLLERRWGIVLVVVAIATLEELSWRGLLLDALAERVGWRRAWLAAALLYPLALVPTSFMLADPTAGPNPLLPLAALAAGLPWSFFAARQQRLPPVIVAHAAFAYFSTVQLRLPGL